MIGLTTTARQRLLNNWRPGTWSRYSASFKRFVNFCMFHKENPFSCSMELVLAFTEWLVKQKLSAASIHNYLTAIKTVSLWLGVNTRLWSDPSWKWNRNSLSRCIRKVPKEQSVLTFVHFLKLIVATKGAEWTPFRLTFILAYLGLLRISNLTIKNNSTFDLTRNTTLKDVVCDKNSLLIKIKWG